MHGRGFAGVLLAALLTFGSFGFAGAQASSAISTTITLNGDSIAVDGDGASVDGSTVTITAAGSYSISGALADGQLVVDTEDAEWVTLVLNGVDITSSTSAPLFIENAEAVTITLADGTQNTLTDAVTYVYASADEDEPNAALFSNADLTIDGSGSLTVTANYADAISSDDSLTIAGTPTITITAADDAIRGKDALTISGGTFTITAQGDALKSTNTESSLITIDGGTFTLDAGDDGIQSDRDLTVNAGSFVISAVGDGMHAEYNLTINDGDISIVNSEEGLEAGYITLNGGNIDIVSSDDGINVSFPDDDTTAAVAGPPGRGSFDATANPYYLHINGGTIVVTAEGDGLDSNGSIEMTGGLVIVNGPTGSGNGALDYDGVFNISGGLLVAAGSAGMPQAPGTDSTQNSLLVVFDTQLEAGTLVNIQSADGQNLLTFAPSKTFQALLVSSPDLATGETYTVDYGGSTDAPATDGLYEDGGYTSGTSVASVTVESAVTQIGNARGFGGGMGMPGERPEGMQEPPEGFVPGEMPELTPEAAG